MKKGTRLNSVLLSEDSVSIRFDIPDPEPKQNGIILGGDQGLKDVLNLANSDTYIVTQKVDNHGHSQESIINKVARKKKGSKAFSRAKTHQKNFINWSLNQLDLSNVRQINLEKIWNIGYRCSKSRKMSHWQNTLIRDKITKIALEQGVLVKEQSCTYRSQRCNSCGQVRKANRKGKMYECKNCGNVCDADMNAAINHSIVLPDIPWTLRNDKINRKNGFFWKPEGFFDYQGGSLQSPLPVNDNT
jgi:transposase